MDRYPWLTGALLFVGAVQFLIMLNVSTALYPDYDVNYNYISDLGATCRATCIIQQPSSIIFNSSTFLFGGLSLGGFYLLLRQQKRGFAYLGILSGIGATGVGLFTEEARAVHAVLAVLAFGTGALTAITAYRYVRFPFNLFSILMGVAGLVFLGLLGVLLSMNPGDSASEMAQTLFGLGFGGLERPLAYAIVLWELGFGAYLMNSP